MILSEFAAFSSLSLQQLPESADQPAQTAVADRWPLPSLGSAGQVSAPPSHEEQQMALEEMFEAARQQAYEDGRAEGLEQARKDIDSLVNALTEQQLQLKAPLEHIDQMIMQQLIAMAGKLAEKILHVEIRLEPEIMLQRIEHGLHSLMETDSDLRVRMHTEDVQALKQLQGNELLDRLHIVEDPLLARGDCCLETPTHLVESNLQEQLDFLVLQLSELVEQTPDLTLSGDQEPASELEQDGDDQQS